MTARVPPDDEDSGNPVPSSDWNEFPRGEIARKTLSTNSSGTTTTEVILTEDFTVGDDRQVQLHATVTVRSDIAGGAQAKLLVEGVQVQRKNIDVLEAGVDHSWSFFTTIQPGAAGT